MHVSPFFWEQVKAKAAEEESEQRESGAASWKVCAPQMSLFLVIRASRVWTLSPACFLRRGDCLPACLLGTLPLAGGGMTSLGFLLTTRGGVGRPL